jgi:hypothetical protein
LTDDIQKAADWFKEQVKDFSAKDSKAQFEIQRKQTDHEYERFLEHHERGDCYLCGKPISTISKKEPCLHWLLRRCKFKKKDFHIVYEKYDFFNISAYLRWVANTEASSKNINNLKEESSDRKVFETTIKWKNVEWTLDCSKNDFEGHSGTKTDFPHWHFQMRIEGNQFINFSDFHIPLSKDDQLKLILMNDPDSGFIHSFGPGGEGMQERMDHLSANPDDFIANVMSTADPEEGAVHMQSMIMGGEKGIPGEKIEEAFEMHRKTGKTLNYCFKQVLSNDENVSIATIASPADSVPEIAKRTERKRR